MYAVLPSSIFCYSAFGVLFFIFSYIERVSELHVPTSTRKGLKPDVRLIPGDTCFLVCCTDLKDYLEHCIIDGDKLGR